MKRVLIISPHFPPVNAPDMQRVRMSLPFYKEMGWEAEVICVDEQYTDGFTDELLSETIPADIPVHKVKALPLRYTRKFGLGSLSIRSYYHFKQKGTELLEKKKFDLVFFSTTMFHVIALGRYWKEKFGGPFVVDMQDPWRNDFYLSRPKSVRPPKFKMAYTIHKKMEAYTMPHADGIISVSKGYINELQRRYPVLASIPSVVIPFGLAENDFVFTRRKQIAPEVITATKDKINVVYIGALLRQAFIPMLRALFTALKTHVADIDQYHFYFIGTSYATGTQEKIVEELADELGIPQLVTEIPERISYFSALATLMHADILLIPGSVDKDYNASKVYNNVFAGKPVFCMFHEKSLVFDFIRKTNAGIAVGLNEDDNEVSMLAKIEEVMPGFQTLHLLKPAVIKTEIDKYSAFNMTARQVELFNKVVS
ncbi:MAG: glycosyltransferase [Chitinophagaceae bacterium]|nr:glycosyltransferase [Chitinophagaceae bacterium]